jgi:hypothetical protein
MESGVPHSARARFLAAIGRRGHQHGEPTLLCQVCVDVLPVQHAAIAIHVAGSGLEVLCASDDVAERLEWMQITLGEGPGVAAVASGGPVLAADLTASNGRWPNFAAEAAAAGIGALYALPLEIGAIRVGVLNLYRDAPAALDTEDFADVVAIAELITSVLLTVGGTGRITEALDPWWDQPPSTREVHQATGMIVAQLGVTAQEAYVRMQGYAYSRGRTLRDVAHAVVERRLRFEQDPDANTEEMSAQW